VLPYVEREAIVRGRAGAAALRPTGNNEPGC
jgi:hypothetical protein